MLFGVDEVGGTDAQTGGCVPLSFCVSAPRSVHDSS
jgi:hypothetical protein